MIDGQVTKVRFSLKSEVLVVLSRNMNAYVFRQREEEFKELATTLQFDNEVPIQVQFTDDGKDFLIETNNQVIYKFKINDLDCQNNIFIDKICVTLSIWNVSLLTHSLSSPDYNLNNTQQIQQSKYDHNNYLNCAYNPAIIGGNTKLYLTTD